MRILFTRNSSVMSRIIRAVTREPVSHCVIECGGWIIHSNLRGVHVVLPQTFLRTNEVVCTIEVPFSVDKVMATLAKNELRYYDVGAILYLGLRYLLPFLPKKNLWQSTGMYMYTEWVTEVIGDVEDSMITPYQLYLWLDSKQGEFK